MATGIKSEMSNVMLLLQARLASTRLPQKVLAPFCGIPMLAYQVRRLRRAECPMIVLTPEHDLGAIQRDTLDSLRCSFADPPVPAEDVVGRFAWFADLLPPDTLLVRVCGDCPLLCPALLGDLIQWWNATPGLAYLGMGPGWPDGLADYDLFTREALLAADRLLLSASDREHLAPAFWKNLERFSQMIFPAPAWVREQHWPKLSVDTPEDLAYVERVAQHVTQVYGEAYTWIDVLAALRDEPALQRAPEPMNSAYVAQVAQERGGAVRDWNSLRYFGASSCSEQRTQVHDNVDNDDA